MISTIELDKEAGRIENFLTSNGYEMFEKGRLDGVSESRIIRFLVIGSEEGFTVRYALLDDFDRWANSGFEEHCSNADEVIAFFKNETKLLTKAISEIVYESVEEIGWLFEDKKLNEQEKNDALKDLIHSIMDYRVKYKE